MITIRCSRRASAVALVLAGAAIQIAGPAAGAIGATAQAGFGAPQADVALVKMFDKDGNRRLDSAERRAALEYLKTSGVAARGRRGGAPGAPAEAVTPGPHVAREAVRTFARTTPFYDEATLRTIFFDFADADWEDQLMAFKNTDVEVPATLTVDGRTYPDADVQFRGMSSFMMVPEGRKHSINVTLDNVRKSQDLGGYTSLNLLNAHEDATLLRSVLFLDIAREYLPAPKANFVRVVINGESWGIYSNVQQVDKTFLDEWFRTKDGTRWKVPGSPNGRGGLEYWGGDLAQYKRTFEIKGKDTPEAWAALVELTRVLNETPVDRLEAALEPILDVDGTLRFLALDNTLVNNDGYWVRASDYNLYRDPNGRFHVLPHDTNETFGTQPAGRGGAGGRRGAAGPMSGADPGGMARGRGPDRPAGEDVGPGRAGGRGPGRGGRGMMGGDATLDPLVGLDDASKPLRSKLLAVPALRAKYLAYTRDIATKWLDWATLGPRVARDHDLIAADVHADTRKLDTNDAFDAGVDVLRTFAAARRTAVLNYSPK
jgi:spore coat protein CotH